MGVTEEVMATNLDEFKQESDKNVWKIMLSTASSHDGFVQPLLSERVLPADSGT